MELSALHDLTLQVLRGWHEHLQHGQISEPQFVQRLNAAEITHEVAARAHKLGMRGSSEELTQELSAALSDQFVAENGATIRSVLWQLVGLGILIPRRISDELNQFFELSAYGKQVLQGIEEGPYDPLGYMRRLRMDAPHLEQDSFDFVAEAVACFLGHHLRAAAVMLGLASENEVLKLADLYRGTLNNKALPSFEQGIRRNKSLKDRFDYFYSRLYQEKHTLPVEIRELDTWLVGIFHVIRLHRNDAGHPTGHNPSREIVYANLTLFLTYARHLSALKKHLSELT